MAEKKASSPRTATASTSSKDKPPKKPPSPKGSTSSMRSRLDAVNPLPPIPTLNHRYIRIMKVLAHAPRPMRYHELAPMLKLVPTTVGDYISNIRKMVPQMTIFNIDKRGKYPYFTLTDEAKERFKDQLEQVYDIDVSPEAYSRILDGSTTQRAPIREEIILPEEPDLEDLKSSSVMKAVRRNPRLRNMIMDELGYTEDDGEDMPPRRSTTTRGDTPLPSSLSDRLRETILAGIEGKLLMGMFGDQFGSSQRNDGRSQLEMLELYQRLTQGQNLRVEDIAKLMKSTEDSKFTQLQMEYRRELERRDEALKELKEMLSRQEDQKFREQLTEEVQKARDAAVPARQDPIVELTRETMNKDREYWREMERMKQEFEAQLTQYSQQLAEEREARRAQVMSEMAKQIEEIRRGQQGEAGLTGQVQSKIQELLGRAIDDIGRPQGASLEDRRMEQIGDMVKTVAKEVLGPGAQIVADTIGAGMKQRADVARQQTHTTAAPPPGITPAPVPITETPQADEESVVAPYNPMRQPKSESPKTKSLGFIP